MPIPANQARANFTSTLVAVYSQIPEVRNFLNIFFPDAAPATTRYLSWAVERQGEPVAIDVIRGQEGTRNTFSITSEKIVDPPFYNEYTDITNTDHYYRAFASQNVDEGLMAEWTAVIAKRMESMRNKILRALELQRSQILTTGVVTMANGDNVDFKRKTASKVDLGSGNYWDQTTVSPFKTMEDGCNFLRTVGKAAGSNFIAVMGQSALNAFLTNAIVKDRADKFQMKLDLLAAPLREANGSAYHGRASAGSYTVDLFTYPEFYDLAGTPTPYIPTTNMILLPETTGFSTQYGAVPFLPAKAGGNTGLMPLPSVQPGKFVIGDYIDPRAKAWMADISCAGIALPTAIDRIYTVKVIGS